LREVLKSISLLLIFTLFLAGCNFEKGSEKDTGLFSGHKPASNTWSFTPPQSKIYREGEHIDFKFSHPATVTVTGTPRITLDVGGSTSYANYLNGSGSKTLTFRYTVQAGDLDTNGIYVQNVKDLNGGSITYTEAATTVNATTQIAGGNLSTVKVDAIAPTVSVSNSSITPNLYLKNQNMLVSASFSEKVLVTGSPKLVLNIGGSNIEATYHSGSNSQTLVFRHTIVSGNLDLDGVEISSFNLNGGTIKDEAGNNANLTISSTATLALVNGNSPYVVNYSLPLSKTYVPDDIIQFSLIFNEAVTVIGGTPSINLDIGGVYKQATYHAGSGTTSLTFRYTIEMDDEDTNGVSIQNVINLNGATITNSSSHPAILDILPPITPGVLVDGALAKVTTITPPNNQVYTIGQTLNFYLVFNKAVTVSGTPRLILNLDSHAPTPLYANYISGSGTTSLLFRYTVLSNHNDHTGLEINSTIDLNSGSIVDANSVNASLSLAMPLGAINTSGVQVDGIIPHITSILAPLNNNYTTTQNLDFTVQFNEAVTVANTPRLVLTIGANTRYATYLSGSGSNNLVFRYTVDSSDIDTDGIALASALDLNTIGTIRDIANQNALLDLTSYMPDLSGVVVNATSLDVANVIAPSNNWYKLGNTLNFTVNFSANAIVASGTPRLELNIGGSTSYANYASGSGTSALVFSYTVQATDLDTDGIEFSSTNIDLNGATIKDASNIDADLNLIANSSLPNLSGVLVDGIIPTFSNITTIADDTYGIDAHIDFTFDFSENITVTGTPRLALALTSGNVYANYLSGSGSSSHIFRYVVQNGDIDLDGISVASVIDLNGGTLKDQAGNDFATLAITPPNTSGILIDGTAANIIAITPPSNGTYLESQNLDFTFTFDKIVTITGTRLVLNIGGQTKYATYFSGSPGTTITYRYTITSPDNDLDGIEINSSIDLNGGSIIDGQNNNATTNFTTPTLTEVRVDAKSPSIATISVPTSKWYYDNELLSFDIIFDEIVNVTGVPSIGLDIGGTIKYANYISGSGTSTLTFEYTTSSGDNDHNGIVLISPLNLNDGTIADINTNNAILSFTPPNSSGIKIDTSAPTIINVQPPIAGTYGTGTDLNFTLTFSESVTITGLDAHLSIDIGGESRDAFCPAGSGVTHVCSYTVTSDDNDGDGIEVFSPLSISSATIKDISDLDAELNFSVPNTSSILVGSAPLISSITLPADGTYKLGDSLDFEVHFNQNVIVTNLPRLVIDANGTLLYANYYSGSNSSTLIFKHSLESHAIDLDGIELQTSIDLNTNGTIKNSANTNASLSFSSVNSSGILLNSQLPVVAYSSIIGTGPVIANGVATSTVTIILKDIDDQPVANITPTFTATNTGGSNNYSSCSETDSNGESTCYFSSQKAETKTVSLDYPIVLAGNDVAFTAGSAVATNSTISGTGPTIADGNEESIITIILKDEFNNPVAGNVPTFSATNTGSTNSYGTCSTTDANGESTCSLKSTMAQIKTLNIVSPIAKTGTTVDFIAGAASVAESSINGTSPVSADGLSVSFIEIILLDAFQNPIAGFTPIFTATDTDSENIYGACSATTAAGISTCTLASSKAESKTLQIVSPIFLSGAVVEFSASLPVAANSTIAAGPAQITADGVETATVTITLRDSSNNPVPGLVPLFDATDTSSGNFYDECTASDGSGVSTCLMTSTKAEVKTLRITSPVTKIGSTVTFIPGAPSSIHSTISGTGPVIADGVEESVITVVIKDAHSNIISGLTPTFTATDTNNMNSYSSCTVGNSEGISTCSLKSTRAESKVLAIATPVVKNGDTVSFTNGSAFAAYSTIEGTGPVSPNGTSQSTITITLKDEFDNSVAGVTPSFTATDSGSNNTYGACSSSNASGESYCTLASLTGEIKTLSITSPFNKDGGTVEFDANAAVAEFSEITATDLITADGSTTSLITITLRDGGENPVLGQTPQFNSTGSNNTKGSCTSTNASGVSTCTLASTKAEIKNLSISAPFYKAGPEVQFIAGTPAIATSSITTDTPTCKATGSDPCSVTITILDAFNNPVSAVTPTFSASGTGNSYGACSSTDSSGISTCSINSTYPELKTLSITSPITKAGNPTEFYPNGINLEVPIDMIGKALSSGTAMMTFSRTRTSLDTTAYIAETNEYFFEVIATNTNTTNSYQVSLYNNATLLAVGSTITIPANTTTPRRFRVQFTPTAGANDYRIRLAATAIANQLTVYSAKMIVKQTAAVATRLYIPLVGHTNTGAINTDANDDATAIVTSVGTGSPTPNQGLPTNRSDYFYHWERNDSYFDRYHGATPWTLETVSSTNANNQAITVTLFNKTTNTAVAGASTANSKTTLDMLQTNFATSATNFTNGHKFEVRINTTGTQTQRLVRLHKAGLWVNLKYLKKAEVVRRIAMHEATAAGNSTDIVESRFLWTENNWTNPSVHLQVSASNSASTVFLMEHSSDVGNAGAIDIASAIPSASYSTIISGNPSLIDGKRYFITHDVPSGSGSLGGVSLLIRVNE
jgi:hypothetical protein